MNNYPLNILLKELDLIDNTISRLDSQIQTSKNFCIVVWTAWIGWFISDKTKYTDEFLGGIFLASAVLPILFWIMDFKWRKPLLSASLRQMKISVFLNAISGKQFLKGESVKGFPLLDPVGWLYNSEAYTMLHAILGGQSTDNIKNLLIRDQKKLILSEKTSTWKIMAYKDAKWFFPSLITISLFLGLFYFLK